jgi:signal transduction histidine kinase
MSRRSRWTWIAFWVCALLVIDGLAWITWSVVRLDRDQRRAQVAAQHEERVRLALWRMDSRLTPLISQESARPYFEYRAFYPAQRAYSRMWSPVESGEVRVASPLLTYFQDEAGFADEAGGGAPIKLHFQIEPDGTLTSPQTPTGEELLIAQDQLIDPFALLEAESRLALLGAIIATPIRLDAPVAQAAPSSLTEPSGPSEGTEKAAAKLDDGAGARAGAGAPAEVLNLSGASDQAQSGTEPGDPLAGVPLASVPQPGAAGADDDGDAAADAQDLYARQSNVSRSLRQRPAQVVVPETVSELASESASESIQASVQGVDTEAATDIDSASILADSDQPENAAAADVKRQPFVARLDTDDDPRVRVSPFSAVWLRRGSSPELLLLREVTQGDQRLRQGVWLDWPALRADLLDTAGTLLPEADLIPTTTFNTTAAAARLAALPVMFDAGSPESVRTTPGAPVLLTLSITWIAVLGGTVAIGLVLRESVRLSERRGRFVSAVTHELRTPLTTFTLYTQMLADGLVKDEDAKREYLHTLKRESGRLGEVVESVLAYARLGQPRPAHRDADSAVSVGVRHAIEQALPSLETLATDSGMRLECEIESLGDAEMTGRPESIGRILSNLVENACKYAGCRTAAESNAPDSSAADSNSADSNGARILLSAQARGESRVAIRVRDFGPGVPPREAKRIFQAFHRAPDERAVGGLGIGLTLSHGLARELGGDLRLVPTEDHGPGACFELVLPVVSGGG